MRIYEMKTKPTQNRGAAIRSAVIKAKLKRVRRRELDACCVHLLNELLEWVSECDERASKRKGGLGRK